IDRGKIVDILPSQDCPARYLAAAETRLDKHIVFPGLVNTHGHLAMSLLRGYADDYPLQAWLEDHIWPVEGRMMSRDYVAAGARLAMAEMIKSGTTAFSDNYFFPEAVAEVAVEVGMRGRLYSPILDFPNPWASGADEAIDKSCQLIEQYAEHPRVRVGFGPHAPYTVSDHIFARIAELEPQYQCGMMIHLHETGKEVEDSLAHHGQRPSERLRDLGVLNERAQCVHMTQVDDTDIEILQASGAHVLHCPESNLKLASGFCPVQKLWDAGINVALGTDGAASNNDLDMLGELTTASLLAKGVAADASALNAYSSLAMATINGAKALNMDDHCGSLEVGKQADIAAVALDGAGSFPIYDPVSYLVYNNCSAQVSHVWVGGQALLHGRQLRTIDEAELIAQAQQWQASIQA
ncbi:MAG: TRZ/ATZ family hydrolase, partial [Cellvibrionaceae bacterium]|nr:TRZ/ATZ family hydrolase [Cellvibrionaceae bacterium]